MVERNTELRSQQLRERLHEAARQQNKYDLDTICLIAPASPTPLGMFYDDVRLHHAITEGLLGRRPYAGAEPFNMIEQIAVDAAKSLFEAEHANVQPHSVSGANQAVYMSLLDTGDRVLAMSFNAGGHLTHGMNRNFSGRFWDFRFYGVDQDGYIDYTEIGRMASETKPKLIVCGASSYPRTIDFERLGEIARENNAFLMGDLSHPAGLIVANLHPKPFPHCDVVTFTPDKTMLGPHGGIILCKAELADRIDKAVHPGVQSSVPLHRIYHTAHSLIYAMSQEFRDYTRQIIENMNSFVSVFSRNGIRMVTGGSDTHLMVIDTVSSFGMTGRDAEDALEKIGVLTNRQVIPGETLRPYVASGIRLGTSWITGRGYDELESERVAEIVVECLRNAQSEQVTKNLSMAVREMTGIRRAKDVWLEEQ